MTKNEKIKRLRAYNQALQQIELLDEQIKKYNGLGRDRSHRLQSEQFDKLDKLNIKISAARNELADFAEQIYMSVQRLRDFDERYIIQLRFFAGLSFETIAHRAHVSKSTAIRYYNKALEHIRID